MWHKLGPDGKAFILGFGGFGALIAGTGIVVGVVMNINNYWTTTEWQDQIDAKYEELVQSGQLSQERAEERENYLDRFIEAYVNNHTSFYLDDYLQSKEQQAHPALEFDKDVQSVALSIHPDKPVTVTFNINTTDPQQAAKYAGVLADTFHEKHHKDREYINGFGDYSIQDDKITFRHYKHSQNIKEQARPDT